MNAQTKIKAKGQLQHHFWGTYSATLILKFQSEKDREKAIPFLTVEKLGAYRNANGATVQETGWQTHPADATATLIHAGKETLEAITEKLVAFGADKKKINSMAKSIDFGERFEIEMVVVD